MAYDLYTNVYQGMSTTPVNLYAENYSAGAQAAQYVPTKTTAIIQGALKGIETGQQIVSNQETIEAQDLQNQLRQHQIERLPVTDDIQEAQLKREQALADITSLKTNIAQQTQDLQLSDTQAKLTEEANRLNGLTQLNSKKQELQQVWGSSDSAGKVGILTSGQYEDVFAANKGMKDQFISTVDALPDVPQEVKDNLKLQQAHSKLDDQLSRDSLKNSQSYSASVDVLDHSDLASHLRTKYGTGNVPASLITDKVDLRNASDYIIGPDGKVVLDDYGNPVNPLSLPDTDPRKQAALDSAKTKIAPYIAFEKGTNNIAVPSVSADDYKSYKEAVRTKAYVTGAYGRTLHNQIDETFAASKRGTSQAPTSTQTAQQAPSQPTPEPTQEQVKQPFAPTQSVLNDYGIGQGGAAKTQDPVVQIFKSKAQVTDTVMPQVVSSYTTLKGLIDLQAKDPVAAKSPVFVDQLTTATKDIAQANMTARWKSDPALRAKYESAYASYNTTFGLLGTGNYLINKYKQAMNMEAGPVIAPWEVSGGVKEKPAALNAMGVGVGAESWHTQRFTPEELFYNDKREVYENYVSEAFQAMQAYYKAELNGINGNRNADARLKAQLQGAMNG